MNKSLLSRLLVILLLVVMSLSIVSCDQLPFLEDIFGGEQGNTPNGGDNTNDGGNDNTNDDETDDIPEECQHAKVVNGKCSNCGEIIITSIKDLSIDANMETPYPNGIAVASAYYVKATVKRVIDKSTGEMIIEDETGSINVMQLCSEDDTSYGDMAEKPAKNDTVLIRCYIEKVSGEWRIKSATLVSFEVNESTGNEVLTVEEALEICATLDSGVTTSERYLIRATIKTITNPAYGAMIIMDETGEISVYGTYSEDGAIGYAEMAEKPVKGDEVLLSCTLQNFNGTYEVKNARLVEFTHVEVEIDPSEYTDMTIANAREAELGAKIKISGVVAQITYANGYKPSGVILVDGTSSIYVYDGDVAGQVKVGNTITVVGEKAYWILDDETNNAAKFGYKGACQLDSALLISNDNGNSAFDKSWIEETTVKEIMDTPVSENITNKIFKVTALVKKAPGNGFVNYYIDDIDGVTGSYVYTQCNGGDFGWLDEFDGKFCTVYFVAINAKSSASGCVWRFLPIEVIDEGYTFNTDNAAEYAVKYHGVNQFLAEYTGDPAAEISAQISSELLGFEGATLTYSSSDENVVYFTIDTPGTVTLHCGIAGTATVTITGSYNGKNYSETVEINVKVNEDVDYINVGSAISAENNTSVTVKGIVGPSLVNQTGFYLIDESGAIPVKVSNDVMATIEIGHEVIVSGTRTITKDGGGQICIDSATIVANNYGSHSYSTDSFITGKTIPEINSTADSAEATTKVYVTTAKIFVNETAYSVTIQLQDPDGSSSYVLLYSGGKDQYKWLKEYDGQTITVELALCDWNAKGLKGCVLAVVLEDGTKVLNTLNFK